MAARFLAAGYTVYGESRDRRDAQDLVHEGLAWLDTGRELHVPLPSAAAADEVLTIARAFGYERRDIAALFEVLAHLASAPIRPPA